MIKEESFYRYTSHGLRELVTKRQLPVKCYQCGLMRSKTISASWVDNEYQHVTHDMLLLKTQSILDLEGASLQALGITCRSCLKRNKQQLK